MSSENDKNPNPKVQQLYKREVPVRVRKESSRSEIKRRQEAIKRASAPTGFASWKNSGHPIKRGIFKFFNGIWVGVMAVGGFIAWLISFLLV